MRVISHEMNVRHILEMWVEHSKPEDGIWEMVFEMESLSGNLPSILDPNKVNNVLPGNITRIKGVKFIKALNPESDMSVEVRDGQIVEYGEPM